MFPERLRALRKGCGLSLTELAQELNNSLADYPRERTNTGPQIGSWERGVNAPSYIELMKLADFFNVSLDYLAGRQFTEVELDDLFISETQLNLNGYRLSKSEKIEIYGIIKGFLRGEAQRKTKSRPSNVNDELTLPLDD